MIPAGVFGPIIAMVLLTAIVAVRMAYCRLTTLKRERIHPQKVANSAQMAALIADSRASDNYRNLFELPVLFYVALLTAHVTAQTGILVIALAWAFVVFRYAHSLIHCSYNGVTHRFAAFLLGGITLIALWVVLAAGLFF